MAASVLPFATVEEMNSTDGGSAGACAGRCAGIWQDYKGNSTHSKNAPIKLPAVAPAKTTPLPGGILRK